MQVGFFLFFSFKTNKVPLPPNGQMPGFGLLPTPPFPPMAQPVIPPTPPVQQPFQTSFQAQNEPLTQKAHQVKLHSPVADYFLVPLIY